MGRPRGHKRQRRGARGDSALAPEVRVEDDVEENGTKKRRTQIAPTKTSPADDAIFDLPRDEKNRTGLWRMLLQKRKKNQTSL